MCLFDVEDPKGGWAGTSGRCGVNEGGGRVSGEAAVDHDAGHGGQGLVVHLMSKPCQPPPLPAYHLQICLRNRQIT